MQYDLRFKAGNALPKVRATLNAGGSVLDLTGATVRLLLKQSHVTTSPKEIDVEAVILDAAAGRVEATLTAADLDTPGQYRGEWQVSYGGDIISVPNDSFFTALVMAGL